MPGPCMGPGHPVINTIFLFTLYGYLIDVVEYIGTVFITIIYIKYNPGIVGEIYLTQVNGEYSTFTGVRNNGRKIHTRIY